MQSKPLFLVLFAFICASSNAQSYHCDSMTIAIKSRSGFVVSAYEDLNIDIIISNNKSKNIKTYETLRNAYKSSFGNCYFELYALDSITNSYKNITEELFRRGSHPPEGITSPDEILKYDLEKAILRPRQKRILTFNILNFMGSIWKGQYSLKIFFRAGNLYGYDDKRNIVSNSIIYLESTTINFEVTRDIKTPNTIN